MPTAPPATLKPLDPMNCLWYSTGNGNEKKCRRAGCANRLLTDYPPERCYALCQAAVGECRHFGAEIRREDCASCGGSVQVKVFACAVRGECTIAKQVVGVACCEGCDRFEAK